MEIKRDTLSLDACGWVGGLGIRGEKGNVGGALPYNILTW
jgi:hypothetical protein